MTISTAPAYQRSQSIVGVSPGRPDGDFYPTPPEVTRALLRVEPFFPGQYIWEPACGNGAMSEVLKSTGLVVYSSDLNDHGYGGTGMDFLDMDSKLPDTVIVTNPPFKLASEFIDHAINDLHVEKLCLLMKLSALEGSRRARLLEETGLSRVWVFRNRIQLTRNGEAMRGGGMIAFAWFVWDKDCEGKPEIGWISTKD